MKKFEIKDYDYIGSAIGNAYFSGVSFEQLWSCISVSENREELDSAVTSTIKLNDIAKAKDHEK